MNYNRLSIKELGLLDRLDEASFTHLTELASNILKVPVSLVSIIDKQNDRQFFKSIKGLQEPWLSRGETPLSHSFCQHVAHDDAPLIVENAPEYNRVKDNLAIPDLGVIAYLGVPIHDPQGRAIGALCAIDSDPKKWTDQDLKTLEKLALCVDDAIRLRSALKSSEAMREEQSDFTYAMSHDIKAPIFTLKTLLNELGPLFEEDNSEEHAIFLEKALQTTDRMEQKTTDILKYAYMGRERNELERINLNQIASEVIADLSGIIQCSDAHITIGELPTIVANGYYMRLLFQNLLSNALKFQPEGQKPEIEINAQSDVYETVIDITDNGIGVDEKYQDQIFKLFGRLHTQKDFPGTGLGLALSAKVVSYMNGEISIQSKVGKGTTFSITLPHQDEDAAVQC
ncbi:MAG: ATP-binding protein [Lentilitoribacter sp.]